MAGTGQKKARALLENNLAKAREALLKGKLPNPPFQGALAELFVTRRMGWDCVSGPEIDKYDALNGEFKIEIKSSTNGRKPSVAGKEYDEFCWVKLERRGAEIWVTRITVAPVGRPHIDDRLGGEECIFDSKPDSASNDWLTTTGVCVTEI